MDTSEAGVALRSHTLAHCDEEWEKLAEVEYGKFVRDMRAVLRDSEVVFAVL
jgi:hypothetical protein